MFKVFPAAVLPTGQKVPLLRDWQNIATNNQGQITIWQEEFRDRLTWGLPTGTPNDILVLDVDAKHDGLGNLQKLGLEIPPTLCQKTINGGFHFLFKYPNDGKKYGNKVGIKFKELNGAPSGIDTRGEGGYILWYGQSNGLAIAEAPKWLLEIYNRTEETPATRTNVLLDPNIAKAKFETALEAIRSAPPGEGNAVLNTQAYLVGQMVASQAVSYEYAYEQLFQAATFNNRRPAYEAQETIKSGLKGGMANPITVDLPAVPPPLAFDIPKPPGEEIRERWTPKYATIHDLKDRSKLRKPQLVQDWSTLDIMLTAADGGTGKTTLKMYEAVCMALGEPFLGFPVKKAGAKTLFITGEDSAEKLYSMLGAMVEQMGLFEPLPGNPERVDLIMRSIVIKKDDELCLVNKQKGTGFLVPDQNAFNKVMEAVEDFKPDLIVFDPIASFWGSEAALNDMTKAVTTFMARLARAGQCAIEMINHIGKVSSNSKDVTQFAGRGGTGLPSHSRVCRVMYGVSDEEFFNLTGEHIPNDTSAIMVNVNKFTDGSPLYNKPFLVLRKGYLFSRKEITPMKQLEEMNKQTDSERVFSFIKQIRNEGKYPTQKFVVAHFKNLGTEKISEARVKDALSLLSVNGHMGEFVNQSPHPDGTITEKVLIVVDKDGKEI